MTCKTCQTCRVYKIQYENLAGETHSTGEIKTMEKLDEMLKANWKHRRNVRLVRETTVTEVIQYITFDEKVSDDAS